MKTETDSSFISDERARVRIKGASSYYEITSYMFEQGSSQLINALRHISNCLTLQCRIPAVWYDDLRQYLNDDLLEFYDNRCFLVSPSAKRSYSLLYFFLIQNVDFEELAEEALEEVKELKPKVGDPLRAFFGSVYDKAQPVMMTDHYFEQVRQRMATVAGNMKNIERKAKFEATEKPKELLRVIATISRDDRIPYCRGSVKS